MRFAALLIQGHREGDRSRGWVPVDKVGQEAFGVIRRHEIEKTVEEAARNNCCRTRGPTSFAGQVMTQNVSTQSPMLARFQFSDRPAWANGSPDSWQ